MIVPPLPPCVQRLGIYWCSVLETAISDGIPHSPASPPGSHTDFGKPGSDPDPGGRRSLPLYT